MAKATEVSVQVFRDNLADYVRRAGFGKERIVVTFHGKAVCVLGPLDLIGEKPELDVAPKRPRPAKARAK